MDYDNRLYIEAAIEKYTKLINLDPTNYDFYLKRGGFYIDLKMYHKATRDFTTASSICPEQSEPHYYNGQCFYNTGSYKEAFCSLTKACDLIKHNKTTNNKQDDK